MKKYTVLFVDVKKSQKYTDEERLKIQIYMQSCINQLNSLFKANLEHDVIINAGDSMQGLFKSTTTAVMYFRLFELFVHPVRLRAGIGVGTWNIQIGKWNVDMEHISSTQQDGETYHRARKAIEEVYRKQQHNVRICTGGDDTFANYLLNASFSMKQEQIHKQNQVMVILELLYPFVKDGQTWNYTENVLRLLELKSEFDLNQKHTSKVAADTEHHITIPDIGYDPVLIDGTMKEPEKSILKKNMAERVAVILGCTRQNAASIIKSGNANKIREMDYMALQYIAAFYEERSTEE